MSNVSACFESLMRVLASASDIVLAMLEEAKYSVSQDIKFYQLFAMTMKANKCQNWFVPGDKGEIYYN